MPYGNMDIWVNIESGNGLMPDGAKPLALAIALEILMK